MVLRSKSVPNRLETGCIISEMCSDRRANRIMSGTNRNGFLLNEANALCYQGSKGSPVESRVGLPEFSWTDCRRASFSANGWS